MPYTIESRVRYSEIGRDRGLTIPGVIDYFQDCGTFQAEDLGLGIDYMHAAGVVISGKPIVEYVPLSRGQDGAITTQFTMTTLENLGLLKMDFLGLRTLTVIQNAVNLVNTGNGGTLDLDQIDYNDQKVMSSIAFS